jgi:hypothetical protein
MARVTGNISTPSGLGPQTAGVWGDSRNNRGGSTATDPVGQPGCRAARSW